MSQACEIILLVYDKLEYTRPCVESIFSRTDIPFHLTIVDNGSVQPQTREYLAKIERENRSGVSLLRLESNQGYIGGVNSGLAAVFAAAASPEFCCVISNDTVVFPGWLDEMLAAAHTDPSIGLVNPQWEFPRNCGKDLTRHAGMLYRKFRGQSIEMDWCRGFCFLLRRSLYEKIGGLDKEFAPGYFDDWDYSIRAIDAGFSCRLALGAFVRHFVNATFASQLGKAGVNDLYELRRKLFYRKWGRQLNILMIAERGASENTFRTAHDLAMRMLRGQEHLFLITDDPRSFIRHTDCFLKKALRGSVFLVAAARIFNNLRYHKSKRYAMILCDERMKNALTLVGVPGSAIHTFESIAAGADRFWKRVHDLKFQSSPKD